MKNLFLGIFIFSQTFFNQSFASFRIAKYKDDKACAISYTFDDALLEHATLVAPKLEKLGFRGTFWVNGKTVDENKDPVEKPRASWKQLKKMAAKGHEVSNHGWAHKNFNKLTVSQMNEEIEMNDSAIFANTGVFPVTFCYPFNAKNDSAIARASANRVATRTEQFSMGTKSTPVNLEKKIEELIQYKEWGVAMIHGINTGYDHFTNSQIFWEHLEKVKKQNDQIWVGTFREVAAYVYEQKSVTYTVAKNDYGFVIRPALMLNPKLFNESLTGVIDSIGCKKIKIVQGNKKLKFKVLPERILFDFNPFGGEIVVSFKEK